LESTPSTKRTLIERSIVGRFFPGIANIKTDIVAAGSSIFMPNVEGVAARKNLV
jgi:hypothetical protein